VNRLRFRRLQVAVGRENPTRTHSQRHVGSPVGRAFVGELGLWLWLVVVALDESGVVVPALRTWSFPCGCARVQGGGGVAGRGREVGTGESQAEGMVYEVGFFARPSHRPVAGVRWAGARVGR